LVSPGGVHSHIGAPRRCDTEDRWRFACHR
jgi:hypothetical protein